MYQMSLNTSVLPKCEIPALFILYFWCFEYSLYCTSKKPIFIGIHLTCLSRFPAQVEAAQLVSQDRLKGSDKNNAKWITSVLSSKDYCSLLPIYPSKSISFIATANLDGSAFQIFCLTCYWSWSCYFYLDGLAAIFHLFAWRGLKT